MKHKSPINNIAHSLINNSLHLAYNPANSAFDSILYAVDNIFVHLATSDYYYYDMYMSNNSIEHSEKTKSMCETLHIKDIVCFHNQPPSKFKKEDIALLHTSLHNTYKIFYSVELAQSWGAINKNRSIIIPYGIPQIDQHTINQNPKNKNALIINTDKNTQITNMHKYIASHITNVDMIEKIPLDIQQLYSIMSQYKVVIEINKTINCLCAIMAGCKIITSAKGLDTDFKNIYYITDYSNILSQVQSVLSNDIDGQDMDFNYSLINEKYNYTKFTNDITSILYNIKNKEIYSI